MKIVIQTLDFVLPAELDAFITRRLEKLLEYPVSPISAEVILGEDPMASAGTRFCNIRLIATNNDYLVAQHADSYEHAAEPAIRELVAKMECETL